MQYDRKITISIGNNRRATNWVTQSLMVSELWRKLQIPVRGTETLAAYMGLSKSQQDELKDVGGYVGGALKGPRRKANNVTGRDIVTLDLDNIPPGQRDEVLRRVDSLGCGYCVYSTRKHQPAAPRLRVLLPTDRTVSAEEYEPIARKIASYIGMEYADPTTYEPSRLMYWPSCCADAEYVYATADKPFLAADGILDQYADWRDMTQWPCLPGQKQITKLAVKQGDPEAKQGVVGAFCRVYDINRAMTELIPGVYAAVDNMPGRYTYIEGSTAGGAVLYDNGKFLYSHHATDPCSGKLVNAFDLVRLHKYGDKDEAAAEGTPTVKLPSYTAMCEYACNLPEVASLLNRECYESAIKDFTNIAGSVPDDIEWMSKLEKSSQTGAIKATIDNILIIIENDPLLKGRFALNTFANRGEVLAAVPWDQNTNRRLWDDNDNNGLYWYLERVYKISSNGKVDGALSLHSHAHAFNDVVDYLNSLKGAWDRTPRLDRLLVDYLGAADTPYNRAVTRKAFTAAVGRAMTPGCKYDTMVILTGPQGIGKSTLLDKLSKGWYNDSIRSFEGKDASELLQGVWIVEIAELDAFRSTDISRIKQFLSLRTDRYRPAYGRHVKELPRCCVFFGTCNETEFLRDPTGNRRFWPVDVGEQQPCKNVFRDLDYEIDQIWAEAYARWQAGEPLYLQGEMENIAKQKQEKHREISSREGVIREFLQKSVPDDWNRWSLDKRRLYWAGGVIEADSINTVPRSRVCALEVWCEVFGGSIKEIKQSDAREINAIIAATKGWRRVDGALKYGPYGSQRGFLAE